jgi:hypothetical protein
VVVLTAMVMVLTALEVLLVNTVVSLPVPKSEMFVS